jgi:Uma2 family endonuclease
MATTGREVKYPTSDGRPMAETPLHMQEMIDLIETLQDHFAADPDVYVWGNMMLYYVEGDRRKHISPDVFVVRGVPKRLERDYYLTWKEGKAPDLVVEVTSKSTRREDQKKKFILYRDVLKVPEYFQFDPTEDYLKPPLQGHSLVDGNYIPIPAINGRLPSAVLGLHLEREGRHLRLYNPATGRRLLTQKERMIGADNARRDADNARRDAETRADQAEAENDRLRRELEAALRRGRSNGT